MQRPSVLRRIACVLNEPVMGFLALAAICVGAVPWLFVLPPALERSLDAGGWLIIAAFALEYVVNLHCALRSSPALRVLRLARVLLFGARARHGLAAGADMGIARAAPSGPPQVGELSPNGRARPLEWRELIAWSTRPDERWVHAANLDAAHIKEVARIVELPDVMVDAALRESSYPRLESSARWAAFAMSLPGFGDAPRTPVLLLVSERHLLSLSLHAVELQSAPGNQELPWGTRCTLHVIHQVLERRTAPRAFSRPSSG
ncbi:MAG TPA: hypothetical protein VFA72_06475 [Burkholderiales bacterium]|nr:hypothetical protein [Burkholderiales bacterium]